MRVLLTGSAGQLGQALQSSVPAGVELLATSREQLDLADAASCRAAVEQHRPDWVLNAGAYTAVDKAESEPELARAVNAQAPQAFAEALAAMGGRLLQLSTAANALATALQIDGTPPPDFADLAGGT